MSHALGGSFASPGSLGSRTRSTVPFGGLGRSNMGNLAGHNGGAAASASHAFTGHPQHGGFGEHGRYGRGEFGNRGFFGYGGYGGFYPFGYGSYGDLYPGYLDTYYGPDDSYDYTPYYSSGVADSYGTEMPYGEGVISADEDGYTSPLVTDGATAGQSYYAEGLAAFQRRDYPAASRLAAHALIDLPRDEKVHELMSLALFAVGDYRGAAREAHAALILGPAADWPTLYSYYHDLPTYEKQWDALKKYRADHPSSMEATFLAAYHDLMLGHPTEAKGLLAELVAKVPQDKVATDLLKQIEGGPATSGTHTATVPHHSS